MTSTGTMDDLGIAIPAYNEEAGVGEVLEAVKKACPRARVLVIDDCSKDKTSDVARAHGVEVVRHAWNRNYGRALKTGFTHLIEQDRVRYLAFLDADGTYPPEAIPKLYELCAGGTADVAIGSRLLSDHCDMPRMRRIGNGMFAWLLSAYSGKKITDTGSGLRVFRSELATGFEDLPDGLDFTPAMTSRLAYQEGVRFSELPIEYRKRLGRSKLSNFRDGWRFLRAVMTPTRKARPWRFYLTLGIPFMIVEAAVRLDRRISRSKEAGKT